MHLSLSLSISLSLSLYIYIHIYKCIYIYIYIYIYIHTHTYTYILTWTSRDVDCPPGAWTARRGGPRAARCRRARSPASGGTWQPIRYCSMATWPSYV